MKSNTDYPFLFFGRCLREIITAPLVVNNDTTIIISEVGIKSFLLPCMLSVIKRVFRQRLKTHNLLMVNCIKWHHFGKEKVKMCHWLNNYNSQLVILSHRESHSYFPYTTINCLFKRSIRPNLPKVCRVVGVLQHQRGGATDMLSRWSSITVKINCEFRM